MMRRKSGFGIPPMPKPTLAFPQQALGHSSPSHCPTGCPQPATGGPLGKPLSIREAASLVGCSVWTVRQKLLPMGLPHFRTGPTAQLRFYENQIITWLLRQQEKGGRSH